MGDTIPGPLDGSSFACATVCQIMSPCCAHGPIPAEDLVVACIETVTVAKALRSTYVRLKVAFDQSERLCIGCRQNCCVILVWQTRAQLQQTFRTKILDSVARHCQYSFCDMSSLQVKMRGDTGVWAGGPSPTDRPACTICSKTARHGVSSEVMSQSRRLR